MALESLSAPGVTRGASTITQQLAKNLFLTPDQTLGRKVQEALLAVWLEHNYSKDEILELYLNRIDFGHQTIGIEAAVAVLFRPFGPQPDAGRSGNARRVAARRPSRLNPKGNSER